MSEDLNNHLNAQLQNDLPQTTELDALKARAETMGLKFHPSISLEKLRERVEAALNGKAPAEDDEATEDDTEGKEAAPVKLTPQQMQRKMYDECMRLVRVNITCMNPNKREYEGDIFATGNSLIGTVKKFIPFNTVDGYHVPKILLDVIREKKCQIFVTVKRRGVEMREPKLINEFAIAELPPLTPEELNELARRQAVANGQES